LVTLRNLIIYPTPTAENYSSSRHTFCYSKEPRTKTDWRWRSCDRIGRNHPTPVLRPRKTKRDRKWRRKNEAADGCSVETSECPAGLDGATRRVVSRECFEYRVAKETETKNKSGTRFRE